MQIILYVRSAEDPVRLRGFRIRRMKNKKRALTRICALHYAKLVYRSLLFLLAALLYFSGRFRYSGGLFRGLEAEPWLLALIWIVYAVEMLLRFFPSKLESMGCQKQFPQNYRPTGASAPQMQPWTRTFAAAAAWLLLNGTIGVLYRVKLIGKDILILISLAYGVCDMICILFFCPFQTWFMKNRCCAVCRIYNWDFAMMFTPYLFIPNGYTWSLLGMSLLLLLRWEITVHRHPERFAENTNAALSCKNCEEKLCHHKKQLQHLRRDIQRGEERAGNPFAP